MKLADIGPGLLLAATGIGVGDMVSSTIAGAEYGLTLVWALAAGVVLKFAITEGAARWQLGTGTTLIEGWRDHLPRAVVLGFFVYFVVWSYFVSSALVTASALVPTAIIPSVPLPVWGVIHAVAAFTMVWFGRYERFLAVVGLIGGRDDGDGDFPERGIGTRRPHQLEAAHARHAQIGKNHLG